MFIRLYNIQAKYENDYDIIFKLNIKMNNLIHYNYYIKFNEV